jgi:hypothetical protein
MVYQSTKTTIHVLLELVPDGEIRRAVRPEEDLMVMQGKQSAEGGWLSGGGDDPTSGEGERVGEGHLHQLIVGDDAKGGGDFLEHPARDVRQSMPCVHGDKRVGHVWEQEEVLVDCNDVEGEREPQMAVARGGGG